MKRISPLFCLALMTAPLAASLATPVSAHGRGLGIEVAVLADGGFDQRRKRRDDDDHNNDDRQQEARRYSIDDAINLVESRTGGRYVSGRSVGPSTFVIKVQIGADIVTYFVDLSRNSMTRS